MSNCVEGHALLYQASKGAQHEQHEPVMKPGGVRAIVIAIVSLALFLVGSLVIALALVDLRACLERAASASLGRATHVGSLQIEWGRHITVEARDISVANPAWAREPWFVQIGRLSAVVNPLSLLRGVVRYEKLRLNDVVLILERGVDSDATWKVRGQGAKSQGGLALIPGNRSQFPTLLHFVVENGRIVYRNAKKNEIEIGIAHGTITSATEDTPVLLVVDGTYNGVAARVTGADMDSFQALRDASKPYKGSVDLIAERMGLHFQGTFAEPLDFDGVKGKLEIDVASLDAALKVFGVANSPPLPFKIAGALQRQGDLWQIDNASGRFSANPFSGNLVLKEGKRGEADRLHLKVDFPILDFAPILTTGDAKSEVAEEPGMFVEGQVRAAQLTWGKLRLSDAVLQGNTGPRDSKKGNLTFVFYGGKVEAQMETIEADGNRIALNASVTEADFSRVAALLGVTGGRATGILAARLNLHLSNSGLEGALATARGQAVMAVTGGSIASEILEEASTDLFTLFRKKQGRVPVTCLFGVGTFKDGIVHLGPLHLRASDVALNGSGRVDLLRRQMDIILQPRSGRTFALDRPLSIEGSLTKPSIGLFRGRTVRIQETTPLAPALQAWAATVSC
jgi:AsmA family protein